MSRCFKKFCLEERPTLCFFLLQTSFISFDNANVAAIAGKLKEFNDSLQEVWLVCLLWWMDTPFSFADNIIATKYFNDQGSSTFSKWSNVKSLSCAMNRGVDPPTVSLFLRVFCWFSTDFCTVCTETHETWSCHRCMLPFWAFDP